PKTAASHAARGEIAGGCRVWRQVGNQAATQSGRSMISAPAATPAKSRAVPASPAVPTPSPGAAGEAETGVRAEALERMEELRAAMLRALEVLHAVRAFFEIKPGVTRAEFAHFVGGAIERLPELQALEWIPRVPAEERAALEAAARAEGFSD